MYILTYLYSYTHCTKTDNYLVYWLFNCIFKCSLNRGYMKTNLMSYQIIARPGRWGAHLDGEVSSDGCGVALTGQSSPPVWQIKAAIAANSMQCLMMIMTDTIEPGYKNMIDGIA